jgi:hypothetical protein
VYHGTRNRLWTFVKNMPAPAFWLLLPAHIAATLAFLAWSPFRGTGRATWMGVFDALKGLGPVWRARRTVQRTRRARAADVLSVMAFSPLALLRRAPVVFKR